MPRIFTHKPCLAPIHVNLRHSCGVPDQNGGSRRRPGRGRSESGGARGLRFFRGGCGLPGLRLWAVPWGTPLDLKKKKEPRLKWRSKHKGEGRRPTSPRHGGESAGLPGDKGGPRSRAGRRCPPHRRARLPLPSPPAEEKRNGGKGGHVSSGSAFNTDCCLAVPERKGRLRTQTPAPEHRLPGTLPGPPPRPPALRMCPYRPVPPRFSAGAAPAPFSSPACVRGWGGVAARRSRRQRGSVTALAAAAGRPPFYPSPTRGTLRVLCH